MTKLISINIVMSLERLDLVCYILLIRYDSVTEPLRYLVVLFNHIVQ